MSSSVVTQKTVLETILEWSLDRPMWQRDALRRIIAKGKLDQKDHEELIALCKSGREAAVQSQASPLEQAHLPANPGQADTVTLVSVADVQGVNNLAAGQTLAFVTNGLTIIYGDNGAGKSGYARILKRVCRARHAGQIEPNIYDAAAPKTASAAITFAIGGSNQSTENWQNSGKPHGVLSAISVFDRDCASVHLAGDNTVAFRPFGLDVPDELASACQVVKDTLTAEQKKLEKDRASVFQHPPWKATTAVGKALGALTHHTKAEDLNELAKLSTEERTRLERLREDLAKDPAKAAAEQTVIADAIKQLTASINAIEANTADTVLTATATAAKEALDKREAARIAAHRAFGSEHIAGVGGEVWRVLWEAARRYSTQVAYPKQLFPPQATDAHCVLCQQPLAQEALERMQRFEAFITQDTEQQAETAEAAAATAQTKLRNTAMRMSNLKTGLATLAIQNSALYRKTHRSIAGARLRRYLFLKAMGNNQPPQLPAAPGSPLTELAALEEKLRNYAEEMRRSAGAEARRKLESELAELTDRALLAEQMQMVKDEIDRLSKYRQLEEAIGETSTNAITRLGNEIADSVITPKLRDRFQKEIVKLAADKVRVEIVRSGGKYGAPQYQVRLFAKPDAKVQNILSEGEQTCVALAAFMTELATASHCSALVFDDPVSSLDHRWRKKVAERLVEEAALRQVIVFTHDLVLVNDLRDLAELQSYPTQLVTVMRGADGAGQVADGLPWTARRVEDRLDKIEKDARAAKALYEASQEGEYKEAAAKVYGQLRATWERAVEEIGFVRVIQRHRDYINLKDLKKVSVLTESDCDAVAAGFKKCSDIIEAHDPSSGRNAAPPSPAEVLQDIQALKDWVVSLRDRQKKVA